MTPDITLQRPDERTRGPRNPSLEETVSMAAPSMAGRPGSTRQAGEIRAGHGERSGVACDANDLRQRIEMFLAGSHLPSLRRLRVDTREDQVVLSGDVQTFYERQMAVQFAARVAGVIHIVDSIQVRGYQPLPQIARDDVPRRPTFTAGH